MGLYGSSGRRYETSAEQFKKYTEQLQNEDRTAGTGLSPGYTVQDAMRNQRIQMQQMLYQQQLMQQNGIPQNTTMYPNSQGFQQLVPPVYPGMPPGYIGTNYKNPYKR